MAQDGHMRSGIQQDRGNWQRLGMSPAVWCLTWRDFPIGSTEVCQFIVQDNACFPGHHPRPEPKPKHKTRSSLLDYP